MIQALTQHSKLLKYVRGTWEAHGERQEVKDFCTITPGICIPIFPLALVIEAINLSFQADFIRDVSFFDAIQNKVRWDYQGTEDVNIKLNCIPERKLAFCSALWNSNWSCGCQYPALQVQNLPQTWAKCSHGKEHWKEKGKIRVSPALSVAIRGCLARGSCVQDILLWAA